MRKILIAFSLLVLVLLISSCDGLLNPEPDIHTTQIKYHKVLKDQEHSVIMPLKVGNYWVYKVTELNGDGSVKEISYDTTLVRKDTLINGEKWFITGDPTPDNKFDFICITNTDIGLVQNILANPNYSFLTFEYPIKYKTYLIRQYDYPITMYDSTNNPYMEYVTFLTWVDLELMKKYSIYLGTFDCYKYKVWGDTRIDGKKTSILQTGYSNKYFIPNLGLVRDVFFDQRYYSSTYISLITELIYTNVKI